MGRGRHGFRGCCMGAGALASDTLVVACVCLQSCAGETQKHGMVDARPSRTFSPLLLPIDEGDAPATSTHTG